VVNFSSLWGGKKKPAPKPAAATKPAAKDPRADLIATALALHKTQGAEMRASLQNALQALADRKTLRNPGELARLLALVNAHLALKRLLSHDLRRYLVLAGLRAWTEQEPPVPPEGSAARKVGPGRKVIRR
jgi:hypothetical protein